MRRLRQAALFNSDKTPPRDVIFFNSSNHFASINDSTNVDTVDSSDQDLQYQHAQDSQFQCLQDICLLTPVDSTYLVWVEVNQLKCMAGDSNIPNWGLSA